MLTTLAMVVVAVAVLFFARGGRRPTELDIDRKVIQQDLGYFLVMYSLAVIAGLLHSKPFDYALVVVLVVGYVYYVRRHFLTETPESDDPDAESDIHPLYFWGWLRTVIRALPAWTKDGPVAAPFVQVAVAPGLIIFGAEIFVDAVSNIGAAAGIPPLAFSLLVAPLATELPEKFNSVIWVRRRKDTLAMGNMTWGDGVPVGVPRGTIGLLFTPWELHSEALVAAVVALLAGSVLYLTLRIRGKLTAPLLLVQGVFYVCYVGYVLTKL